jgi:hypothetical protein
MDHLVELCREGRIGGVGMGVPEATARAVLGRPDDETVSYDPHVLLYGGVELAFADGELEMITLGFGHLLEDLPASLPGEIPRIWGEGDRETVLASLSGRGVALTAHPHPGDGVHDYTATTTMGDVVNVLFTGGRLSGVACSRAERAAPRILFLPAPATRPR